MRELSAQLLAPCLLALCPALRCSSCSLLTSSCCSDDQLHRESSGGFLRCSRCRWGACGLHRQRQRQRPSQQQRPTPHPLLWSRHRITSHTLCCLQHPEFRKPQQQQQWRTAAATATAAAAVFALRTAFPDHRASSRAAAPPGLLSAVHAAAAAAASSSAPPHGQRVLSAVPQAAVHPAGPSRGALSELPFDVRPAWLLPSANSATTTADAAAHAAAPTALHAAAAATLFRTAGIPPAATRRLRILSPSLPF